MELLSACPRTLNRARVQERYSPPPRPPRNKLLANTAVISYHVTGAPATNRIRRELQRKESSEGRCGTNFIKSRRDVRAPISKTRPFSRRHYLPNSERLIPSCFPDFSPALSLLSCTTKKVTKPAPRISPTHPIAQEEKKNSPSKKQAMARQATLRTPGTINPATQPVL